MRFGRLSEKSKELITTNVSSSKPARDLISSTHVVGLRKKADEINELICEKLPLSEESLGPFVSAAMDMINHSILNRDEDFHFNHHTNLPKRVTLQEGAKVMFLNNKLFDHGICNGTVGVVTRIIDHQNVEVTFPTAHDIAKVTVQKEISYFDVNGSPASRQQFPLQNALTLTVYKTQGLTLPHATVSVDEGMFAPGQAYVAMSRASSWGSLEILDFDFCVKTDHSVIQKYARLKKRS